MPHTGRTYNLKAVVQETGVKPDALRAWERRYGLPKPARSKGGHRLYSRRDVDIVKWLVARREEGLLIGRAVELWRELEAEGEDPLQAMPIEPRPAQAELEGAALDALTQTFVEACEVMDEPRAEIALAQALAGYPPRTALLQVAARGLKRLGEEGDETGWRWAASLVERRVQALMLALPPATRGQRVIVANVAGPDGPGFDALTLTYLLRFRGLFAVHLPAFESAVGLAAACERSHAAGMVLLAADLMAAAALAEIGRELGSRIPLAFGGDFFDRHPHLAELIPGHFLGPNAAFADEAVDAWLAQGPPRAEPRPLSPAELRARDHFLARRAAIEARVWQELGPKTDPRALAAALRVLGDRILAALALGEPITTVAAPPNRPSLHIAERADSIDWNTLLRAYRRAAEQTLDEAARLYLDRPSKRGTQTE